MFFRIVVVRLVLTLIFTIVSKALLGHDRLRYMTGVWGLAPNFQSELYALRLPSRYVRASVEHMGYVIKFRSAVLQ